MQIKINAVWRDDLAYPERQGNFMRWSIDQEAAVGDCNPIFEVQLNNELEGSSAQILCERGT